GAEQQGGRRAQDVSSRVRRHRRGELVAPRPTTSEGGTRPARRLLALPLAPLIRLGHGRDGAWCGRDGGARDGRLLLGGRRRGARDRARGRLRCHGYSSSATAPRLSTTWTAHPWSRRRSVTTAPVTRTRSPGVIGNTSVHVPAAAHTSSYVNRSGSQNTRSAVALGNGGTPPIGKPVASRTVSASTRRHSLPPAAAASLASSSWFRPLT